MGRDRVIVLRYWERPCRSSEVWGETVSQFRRLVAGFSPRKTGFGTRTSHVSFVVARALGEFVYVRDIGFSSLSFY